MASSYDIIEGKIGELRRTNTDLEQYQDHQIFSYLCMKHYFYDLEEDFDADECMDAIIDGAKDGGIDAVLRDPQGGDMLLIQSKYYSSSTIDSNDVIAAIHKIQKTKKDIEGHRYENYKADLVSKIKSIKEDMSDEDSTRIYFFTSQDPKTKRARNKIEREIKNEFPEIEITIQFGQDICKQIENSENAKTCVEYGSLNIDRRDNTLIYADKAILANVSAHSLQDLYTKYDKALFSLNLRYYIRNKSVDSGIDDTIEHAPSEFWYRNNGITIICDRYSIDGTVLKLYNFSIINGGQTTYKIGRATIEKDFYLLCKVIARKTGSREEQDEFVIKISQASNAQKPIKQSDLRANTPEQLYLKSELIKKNIYYVTKRGDKPTKGKHAPYETTTIQKLGKLSLAAILQQPGIARNNPRSVYKDGVYDRIYRQPNIFLIKDLLRVEYYLDTFKKRKTAVKPRPHLQSIIGNGSTFQLACIALLFAIHQNQVKQEDLYIDEKDPDEIRKTVYKALKGSNSKPLFKNQLSENEERELFYELFDIIAEDILLDIYETKLDEKKRSENKDLSVSDFLKKDKEYCESIIRKLLRVYNKKDLPPVLDKLCGINS